MRACIVNAKYGKDVLLYMALELKAISLAKAH